mgnify:CR=1 FL=1
MRSTLVTALTALVFGFGGAALWSLSGLGNDFTKSYLLDNPEILPEMAEKYEQSLVQERLAAAGDEVTRPFPGAILGNPEGSITLVKFTDYGCSFCKMSRPHIDSLIAANPELKVVIREWPIFEGSDRPAKMALAAAQQGKFPAFHDAMFNQSSMSDDAIMSAAAEAGLDLAAAQDFINSPAAGFELSKNTNLARQLGFGGTPSWVVGSQAFEGAVGTEKLQEAIDAARES